MVIQKAGNPAFCFIKKRWKEVKKLATKLKNLHIRKVDFVDEGANQRADIKIAKKKMQILKQIFLSVSPR